MKRTPRHGPTWLPRNRPRSRLVPGALVGFLWCVAMPCFGQAAASTTPAVRPLKDAIEVEPGATCLQHARLVEQVALWLDRQQVSSNIRVVVRGDAERRRVVLFDISHGGPVSRRVFESIPDICGDAHAVLSLAIALAIDTDALGRVTDNAAPETTPPLRRVFALPSVGYEVLPALSLGAQLGIELGLLSWMSARLELFAQHSQNDTIAGSGGVFDATLLAGSMSGCAGGSVDAAVRLMLCVGVAAGGVYAVGQGYAPNRSASGFWFGIRNGVRIEVLAGIPWLFDVDVFSVAVSPSFQTRAADAIAFQRAPSATGFLLSVGPALTF